MTRLRADPDTSEEEHFQMMLVQTEMERVRFIVRSYLRTRLYKVSFYVAIECLLNLTRKSTA